MLHEWALAWGVPYAALDDLRRRLGTLPDPAFAAPASAPRSEAWVQTNARMTASREGWRVWRNNVGVLKDSRGVPVRYGLANDSEAINRSTKSGDLIGCRPELIGPQHVGQTFGRFVSWECKEEGWHFTGTPREVAQQNWALLVLSLGGDARFVSS